MRVSVVGIPESSRVAQFCAALRDEGLPAPEVFSWVDVLDGATPTGWVRLDSPGRNWNTEQRLLILGADGLLKGEYYSEAEIRLMSEPAGRIVAMPQWYRGWCRALGELKARSAGATFLSSPEDVACLFDKHLCQQRLESAGCRMPRSLGLPEGFDDLIERMRAAQCPRVFLKPCHGSSASGVVALETSGTRMQAFTTVRMARGMLWNHRPGTLLRELTGIASVVDAVCRQRAQAQAWVPKLGWRGHRVDLRIVTVAGHARQVVVRMSRTPITNLQLWNRRGPIEEFEVEHDEYLASAKMEAERVAAAFPDCLALGVDVAIDPAGRPWVLEANAFGDLLPGCLVDGMDAYRWQVQAMRERCVSSIGS